MYKLGSRCTKQLQGYCEEGVQADRSRVKRKHDRAEAFPCCCLQCILRAGVISLMPPLSRARSREWYSVLVDNTSFSLTPTEQQLTPIFVFQWDTNSTGNHCLTPPGEAPDVHPQFVATLSTTIARAHFRLPFAQRSCLPCRTR